jgi:hypothetical protein
MCVRVCASTETHFMIKNTSECVYKYQQICLILYTEVQKQKLSQMHTTRVEGALWRRARFHSEVATAVNVR